MNILVVDDERLAVDNILALLRQAEPDAVTAGFTKPAAALEHLCAHPADIAFLDIELGSWSGIALARACKDLCPRMNIIFVTAYPDYTLEAFRLHASGYLLKPVRLDDLRAELDNLRHPLPPVYTRRVRIQTFGNFEIFADGKPLPLSGAKCRECLAYLVDRRGARVTYPELVGILWGDRPYDRAAQNNLHRLLSDLREDLRRGGVSDILLKTRKDLAIDTERVDCDYYAAIAGDAACMTAFTGEYMSNYSWAEFTLGELCRRVAPRPGK